jgi:3-oxoacyl-[acyl-carrier protein] reductase
MNKVAIVTGSSRGLGSKMVKNFAKDGYNVVINYNSDEKAAKEVEAEILAACPDVEVLVVKANVGDQNDAVKLVEATIEKFGRIDVLVNNAGVTNSKLFLQSKFEDYAKVMQINMDSVFHMCKAVHRTMSKQKFGRIINMSSVVGLHGNIGQLSYATSKAAMIGFTKSLAKEVANKKITVNAIAPGYIQTDMVADTKSELIEAGLKNVPLGRLGEDKEVADLVSFLASDKSGYITGQVIVIDGGMTI